MKAKDLLRNLIQLNIPTTHAAVLLALADGEVRTNKTLIEETGLSRQRLYTNACVLVGQKFMTQHGDTIRETSYKITAAGQREVVKMLSRREVPV